MHIGSAESPAVVSAEVPRVLGIPEVLARILENATKGTNAVALRVCRFWFDVGMEVLWRDLDVLVPLFTLVEAPLTFQASRSGDLWDGPSVHTFRPGSWNRFRLHASCVKRLTYDAGIPCCKRESSRVASAAILALAWHHPSGLPLLPNLRTLIWKETKSNQDIVSVMPFLSFTLTHLELYQQAPYDPSDQASVVSLFRALGHRSPSLQNISLSTNVHVRRSQDIHESLVDCISSQRSLLHLALPSHLMIPQILVALAQNDSLRSLKLKTKKYRTPRDTELPSSFSPAWFLSLETLELDASGGNMIYLFCGHTSFSKLRKLLLVCSIGNPAGHLKTLSTGLAASCPHLSTLTPLFHSQEPAQPIAANCLSYDSISPLSACLELKALTLGHTHPFLLYEDDVEEIGQAWRAIRRLILCPDPSADHFRQNPSLGSPITILKHVARCLPSLVTFGLCFDPIKKADLVGAEAPIDHAFNNLTDLMAGMSKVPDNDPLMVGQFLESLCSTSPKISTGLVTGYQPLTETEQSREWLQRWTEVTRTFSVIRARRLGTTRG